MNTQHETVSSLRISSVSICPHGFFLTLPEDRDDFWLYLGGILGWGLFVNSDKLQGDSSEWREGGIPFTLVTLNPANSAFPPPRSVSRFLPVPPREYFEMPIVVHSSSLPSSHSAGQGRKEKPGCQDADS